MLKIDAAIGLTLSCLFQAWSYMYAYILKCTWKHVAEPCESGYKGFVYNVYIPYTKGLRCRISLEGALAGTININMAVKYMN